MNKKTEKALRESIAHWERIAEDPLEPIGAESCALCNMFNNPFASESDFCVGCPVYAFTGRRFCFGTPYALVNRCSRGSKSFKLAALDELNFLKSLLPKKKTK